MSGNHDAAWLSAAAHNLVPWVGAGVPRGLHRIGTTYEAFTPDWFTFLRNACKEIAPDEQRPRIGELIDAEMAEEAATLIRDSVRKQSWTRFLRQSFERTQADLRPDGLPLLRSIWGVGNGLVLTTNYDPSLSWGSPAQAPTTFGLHAGLDLTTLLAATRDSPVLWHLHGTIQHPDSIVVERNQYDRLYGLAPAGDREGLPGDDSTMEAAIFCLRTMVATQNLLFLGTSLADHRVRDLLKQMQRMYPEARNQHYLVCRADELSQTESLLSVHGLRDYLELLAVEDWTRDFQRRLQQLASDRTGRGGRPIAVAKWIRRRCRTLVAGRESFVERAAPILGEFTKAEVVAGLTDMIAYDDLDHFEETVVQALREEFRANPQRMKQIVEGALVHDDFSELQRLNLKLLYGIALEKSDLDGVELALREFDLILGSPIAPDELKLCAQFNRMVCIEKINPGQASFEEFLGDREYRFATGELLWTKAWSMELVRCARLGVEFPHGEAFDDVVAAEVDEDSTGVATTIANWGHYKGQGTLSDQSLKTLVEKAKTAPPTQRVPILTFLASETQDPVHIDQIHEVLDKNPDLPTLHRFVQTRRIHGRYTLYGEYLMHDHTWGYAAPTSMSLQGSHSSQSAGGIWRLELDEVAKLVERLGLRPLKTIFGDVPFGAGFASSTVLALLHIGDQVDPSSRRTMVNFLDQLAHGFPPSGMDYEAVSAREPGFYLRGVWKSARPVKLSGLFLRVRDPATLSFREARKKVISAADRLVPLANRMTDTITDTGDLDLEAFGKYCSVLSNLNIYTPNQVSIVRSALDMGLVAKAIGGLHAQAMLVVGDANKLGEFEGKQKADVVVGGIAPEVGEGWSAQ